MSDSVELPQEEAPLDTPCHGNATYEDNDAIYCAVCGTLVLELPPEEEPVQAPIDEPANV